MWLLTQPRRSCPEGCAWGGRGPGGASLQVPGARVRRAELRATDVFSSPYLSAHKRGRGCRAELCLWPCAHHRQDQNQRSGWGRLCHPEAGWERGAGGRRDPSLGSCKNALSSLLALRVSREKGKWPLLFVGCVLQSGDSAGLFRIEASHPFQFQCSRPFHFHQERESSSFPPLTLAWSGLNRQAVPKCLLVPRLEPG